MNDRLGLDSVSFDTFGWLPIPGDLGERSWRGEGVVLTQHFFPLPPDLPSLDPEELRLTYQGGPSGNEQTAHPKGLSIRSDPEASDPRRTMKIIELSVARDGQVPVVRVILRVPLPDRYAFVAALTLPVATCSWVVKVQALEPDPTGIREALALDSLLRGESALGEERDKRSAEMTLEETMAGFDPYHSRWDGLINDPLTDVRRHVTLVEQSLVYRPEVLDEAPFRG